MQRSPGGIQGGRTISIVSWNVRGLGHTINREKVFRHEKSFSADIILLQETQMKTSEQRRLRCSCISQIYQLPFTSHARGVAILFKKYIPFQLTSMVTDPSGRYVMVSGIMNSFQLTFLNIYGANTDEPNVLKKIYDLLPNTSNSSIIIGGDLNCHQDPYLDRLSTCPPPNIASVQVLNSLLKSRNLVDI